MVTSAVILLLASASAPSIPAEAEGTGPGTAQFLRAARVTGRIRIDGSLDEPAWAAAEPFEDFVQIFPGEGTKPSERTVVRVLYDDRNLYVGIICFDREPEQVMRPLGRRDTIPYSDTVTVIIDSQHDHRTGYAFALNAAGVQQDGLYYEDDSYTKTWDAVWDGRAVMHPDGWSAEMAIPLAALRYLDAPEQTWGFGVRREIGRNHEVISSVAIPRNARGVVSRLGHLVGLDGLHERRELELVPFAASRLALRPQRSDPALPAPRLLDGVLDLGLDLKWAVANGLVLNATLNPDFGQVEADEILQNVTTFEIQFPEKRPFFNQGMDLFQPVGTGREKVPQQLFYSRRIGLDAPIFVATKLSGQLSEGVEIGLLDALVAGAGRPGGSSEDVTDRRYRIQLKEPFHLAPVDSLPLAEPAAQNFFAGVGRFKPSAAASLGLWLTSATPLTVPCTPAEAALDTPPPRCTVKGGNATAVDWNLHTRDSEWALYGQAAASQTVGGNPARLLPDGTVIRPGDLGEGTYVTLARQGGEPLRFEIYYEYESPRLELNPAGYQRTQNEQAGRLRLRYVRPSGGGAFHGWEVGVTAATRWTTDGRGLNRGNGASVYAIAQLRNFLDLACELSIEDPHWDVREINGSGIPYLRAPFLWAYCSGSSDASLPLATEWALFAGGEVRAGPLPALSSYGGVATATYRPHPRFESRLSIASERNVFQARWIETRSAPGTSDPSAAQVLFGGLVSPFLSITAREQLVLTPRLTLQAYAQLYTEFRRYGPFYLAESRNRSPIRPRDLVPGGTPSANPDTHSSALNLNLVLRWEPRLGSALYVVYTRSQRELPWSDAVASPPWSLAPRALGPGPTTDTLLVKWSWWLSP